MSAFPRIGANVRFPPKSTALTHVFTALTHVRTISIVEQSGRQLFTYSGQVCDVNCTAPAISALDEGRRHPRRHLFVAATLYSDMGAAPVRIRNMSQSGGLIEAPAIPDPGVAILLKRGSLEVAGQIAWRVDRKAGIIFSSAVNVSDWMSRQVRHQERVDEIVSSLKSGGQPDVTVDAENAFRVTSIVAELAALRSDLVQLGNGLASDSILVATHPEIQFIDISIQRVDRIAGQLPNT